MLRTIVWFIYFWIYQLALIPKYFYFKNMSKKTELRESFDAKVDKEAKRWARSLVKLAGGDITVIGEEKIPADQAVVFVANHQGNFDIPVLLGYIKKPKAFIAKKEAKKMPMIGDWMKFMNCVFMDRSNPREALKAINEGAQNVKDGYSLVIFPEGTRSPDGKLKEFKQGSLKLALKAKAPIVPVAISGTFDMMQKGKRIIRPAKVEVRIGDPIFTDELTGHESKMIMERVWDEVNGMLKTNS